MKIPKTFVAMIECFHDIDDISLLCIQKRISVVKRISTYNFFVLFAKPSKFRLGHSYVIV